VNQIEEIIQAIAQLSPAEKERLFELLAAQEELLAAQEELLATQEELLATQEELLAAQEELPAASRTVSPGDKSPEMPASHSEPTGGPDYVLVFDGGSRGNPGWGYGSYAITRVADGAQRLERLQLGEGYTNNEAEYDSLLAALEDLLQRIEQAGRRPKEFALEVRGDSALVINQLQGKWKAQDPRMVERRDRGRRLLDRFGAVALKSQPREESVRVLGH
jgi:ribonuclease HI